MERIAISLGPVCTACPEVVVDGDQLRIGETENTVVLQRQEWNVLVDLIRSGQLGRLWRARGRDLLGGLVRHASRAPAARVALREGTPHWRDARSQDAHIAEWLENAGSPHPAERGRSARAARAEDRRP